MADVGQLLCVQRQAVRLPFALVARLGRAQHRHALREQRAGLRIAQRIFRRQRQRRQSQQLAGILDVIRHQRQRLRLPLPTVFQSVGGQRAVALAQPFSAVTRRGVNGQRQRIRAQHRALIVQRVRLYLQIAAFQ